MRHAKLRQHQVAAESGIDPSNLSGLLRQASPPRLDTVERLAAALDCDPLDLLDDVITEWGIPLTREIAVTTRGRPPSGRPPARKRSAG